jgi:glutathione S-transferase
MSMLFYYAPGACSMASHIVLEEVGAQFTPMLVDFNTRQQHSPEYAKINPRKRVATLIVDGETLTEEIAILCYIATRFREPDMLPSEPMELGKCLSLMSFIASFVHVSVGHIARPERYSYEEDVFPNMIKKGQADFLAQLEELDRLLEGKQWSMGDRYTVADPYMLVVYRWGLKLKTDIHKLKNWVRFNEQMLQRPAVQRVYKREGNKLV